MKISLFFICSLFALVVATHSQQPATTQQPTQTVDQEAEFFRKAANGSIFIYGPELDPCGPVPEGMTLLPRGSGFVVGIEQKSTSTPTAWRGWKFLMTAKHVLAKETEIYIRVNAAHESKVVCKKLDLHPDGPSRNIVLAGEGIDLGAVSLPDIPDTDPTVAPSSLLLDEGQMQKYGIGVGTQVLTIGYLYSYSGQNKNFPVTKFGHVSQISDEKWYFNQDSKLMEQGYALDLSNAPGLSGSPVFTHGIEFESNPFRYRQLPPYLVGVIKGLMLVPLPNGQTISQGVAVMEPAGNIKAFMQQLAAALKSSGDDVVEIN